jgi:hypothetical protein
MNTKFLSALTATAAATALFSAAAPAQAASFGTSSITFEQDTAVKFNFLGSRGMFQSSLAVYEVDNSTPSLVQTLFSEIKRSDKGRDNEWRGTPGNTVLDGEQIFTFVANKIYALGLESDNGTVYSSSSLNTGSGGSQQAVFGAPSLWNQINIGTTTPFAPAAGFTDGLSALFGGGSLISFDDRGNGKDSDFQDFTVTAQAVPEPMTMTGLALGLGGLVAARRRRSKTAS